jgi:hypothetical protein
MSKHEFYNVFRDTDSGGMAEEFPKLEFNNFANRYYRFTGKPIINWQIIHCSIFDPIYKGEAFEDYQAVIHGCRLCSQRLKDLLENNKSSTDKIQWLDATVTWNDETRPYYLLHFYEDTDVLDPVLSKWNPETKFYDARPVYVREKIGNLNIFSCPGDYLGLTVRAFIVKEMKLLNMTGMTWEPTVVR